MSCLYTKCHWLKTRKAIHLKILNNTTGKGLPVLLINAWIEHRNKWVCATRASLRVFWRYVCFTSAGSVTYISQLAPISSLSKFSLTLQNVTGKRSFLYMRLIIAMAHVNTLKQLKNTYFYTWVGVKKILSYDSYSETLLNILYINSFHLVKPSFQIYQNIV